MIWRTLWQTPCNTVWRGLRTGQHTLKITIQTSDHEIGMTLEGRVAGPWVAELSRIWAETAPHLGQKTLSINLQNVTYADSLGKHVLGEIHAQTHARLIASSPWAQYLAEEIKNFQSQAC